MRAYFASLKSSLVKPIEKVFTGPELARAISPTTVEESMPTLRNAPSGTSEIKRMRVASSSPASLASVLPGDLLIGANGRSFDSVDDLGDAIDRSAGGILRLQFLRGDRRASREVAIALQT